MGEKAVGGMTFYRFWTLPWILIFASKKKFVLITQKNFPAPPNIASH